MRVPSPWATCSRLQGSCTEPRRDCLKSPLQPRKGTLRDYGRGRGDAFSLFLGHKHLHLRRPLAFFRQSRRGFSPTFDFLWSADGREGEKSSPSLPSNKTYEAARRTRTKTNAMRSEERR